MSKKINKKLFAFDMDGTLLADSKNSVVSDKVKNAIRRLKKEGHIVCLFTGRPWRASQAVYEELKLDTVIVNYNGAYIHHPKDYDFIPIIETVSLNHVMRIIKSKDLQTIANNVSLEEGRIIHLMNRQKSFLTEEFIMMNEKEQEIKSPISFHQILSDPIGALIEVKKTYAKSVDKITEFFKAKYGDLVAFSYWNNGEGNSPIIEFTNYRARKDMALIRVARYYGIDMNDTVAFGDAHNDIKMLEIAGVGVAMANADDLVKANANVVARHTNKDNGVAKFIKWYLNGGFKTVDKTIYTLGDKELPKETQVVEGLEK